MATTEKDNIVHSTGALDDKPEDPGTTTPDSTSSTTSTYKIGWRTVLGWSALCIAWASSTFPFTGPTSVISFQVASFPEEAANAPWIANTTIFCIVGLAPIWGTLTDRYGKRWFLITAALVSCAGAVVAGRAKSLNQIIGGQAIVGVGASVTMVSVAALMEIVPAKWFAASFGVAAVVNGTLGAIGGVYVFSACVERNIGGKEGWRFGYYIEAIIFGTAAFLLFIGYHPPPTRLRRQKTALELLKSIDFIGLFLLALGAVLLVLALVWGGTVYPWKSSHVTTLLVVGPLILLAFCAYEWKGRPDGLMHHDFFWSPTFPILLFFGFVDGMLLFGTSVFIPQQIGALYTSRPLAIANIFLCFQGLLLAGYPLFGAAVTKMRSIRLPLIVASALLTLFCGLMSRAKADTLPYFKGMLAVLGLLAASATVIPVSGVALVSPPYLLATSNTVLAVARALGGALGIAVFSAVYRNKAALYVPPQVTPLILAAGFPPTAIPQFVGMILSAPSALLHVPGVTEELFARLMRAAAVGNAESYRFVWYCLMACGAGCLGLSFFIRDAPERMTGAVESKLEDGGRLVGGEKRGDTAV